MSLYKGCPSEVICGSLINKDTRHELFGRVAGGAGSCKPEQFQRQMISAGTGVECPKSNHTRINLRTYTLENIAHPNTKPNGFDYSEDFDGIQTIRGACIYINLKCIVGTGGAQTRSLREVYAFVEGQLQVLCAMKKKERATSDLYFANILDGDEAHSSFAKFEYLLALPEYADVRAHVYVGDLKGYFDWFKERFVDE